MRRLWALVGLAALGVSLAYCVSDTSNVTDGGGPDGGGSDSTVTDAASDAPPAEGFTMSLTPAHVTTDPGDSNVSVTINVSRAPSFAENVSFTIASPPAHVSASAPGDTGNTGTSSVFNVSVDSQATSGDVALQVNGKSASWSASATLQIRIGSILQVGSGTFTVPAYADHVIVKAWGAGGGGAFDKSGTVCEVMAPGGGGGFASALVPVTPSSSLEAIAGTGGGVGSGCAAPVGGSGGGFSALRLQGASSYLVIAGGGGGGGEFANGAGGAGGGTVGQDGSGNCRGFGGSQTQGGVWDGGVTCPTPGRDGGPYVGGDGYTTTTGCEPPPGMPGGGHGAGNYNYCDDGAGGGGGGYFGGSGGGIGSNGSGGGGGSGYLITDAGTLTAGNGTAVANSGDPDFGLCGAGTGVGGKQGDLTAPPDSGAQPGGPGCIVVRLPKP